MINNVIMNTHWMLAPPL